MSGNLSRRSGHDYEREIAAFYRSLFPNAKRGLQSRDGSDVPDVDGTPFWVECKCMTKPPNAFAAMRQATEASDGRPVVLHLKQKRGQELVCITRGHWEETVASLVHFAVNLGVKP